MTSQQINITEAITDDLPDIMKLLAVIDLPTEGVPEWLNGFLVARNGNGQIVGCIGLEAYGEVGLLRSAAVTSEIQGTGIGTLLTQALLERSFHTGIKEMVLLTTTAKDFFSKRFGFQLANRIDYQEQLATSPEWLLPRCSSAAFMKLTLNPNLVQPS